jgi:serine/threonine protein kinase
LKLLDAISTIHDQDMLHRDISPDNILINASDTPILIDFGAVREEASKKGRAPSAVLLVKDGYSPQEFYISGSQQTPCSDLYALAATFCHFITGEAPPNSQARLAALASKGPDLYQPLSGRVDNFPTGFLQIIDKAMSVFPQDRIQTAQEWIKGIDEQKSEAMATVCAQEDLEIVNIVTQLIHNAQQETDAPSSVAASDSGSEVKHPPVMPKNVISEFQFEDLSSGPDQQLQEPVQHATEEENWVARCQQKEMLSPKVKKPKSRVAARLVLGAALSFLVWDGHAAKLAEIVEPVVEQMIGFANKSFGSFALAKIEILTA